MEEKYPRSPAPLPLRPDFGSFSKKSRVGGWPRAKGWRLSKRHKNKLRRQAIRRQRSR